MLNFFRNLDIRNFSFPDWAFYPLASLTVGGMIFGALNEATAISRTDVDILANGVVYEAFLLNSITTGNGLEADFLFDDTPPIVRINAVRGPLEGPHSAGAFYTLTPQELGVLQGHVISLTLTVRTADESGATSTRVSFFTPGIGQDSWQIHGLSNDFTQISLTITPPSCEWTYGYIGVWPDWDVNANTIEIERLEIQALQPMTC